MKRSLIKDKKLRLKVSKMELFHKSLKYISTSDMYNLDVRIFANKRLKSLSKGNTKSTKIVNYCIITGRSKSVYKDFRVSRIKFRELARSGQLYGVTKASW